MEVRKVASLHALGGGASWIWRSVEAAPGKCRETLDVYHALEQITLAGQELYGRGLAEPDTFLEPGRELLIGEGLTGLMNVVGETLRGPEAERRCPTGEKLMSHVAKHIDRLN